MTSSRLFLLAAIVVAALTFASGEQLDNSPWSNAEVDNYAYKALRYKHQNKAKKVVSSIRPHFWAAVPPTNLAPIPGTDHWKEWKAEQEEAKKHPQPKKIICPAVGKRVAAAALRGAGASSVGLSAYRVAKFIRQGTSKPFTPTLQARRFSSPLIDAGYRVLADNEPLCPGDVRVIEPVHDHPYGHAQIYTGVASGAKWCSDFRQSADYPGTQFDKEQPKFETFRLERQHKKHNKKHGKNRFHSLLEQSETQSPYQLNRVPDSYTVPKIEVQNVFDDVPHVDMIKSAYSVIKTPPYVEEEFGEDMFKVPDGRIQAEYKAPPPPNYDYLLTNQNA